MKFSQMLLSQANQAHVGQSQRAFAQPHQTNNSIMPLSSLLQTNSSMNQAPTVNGRLQAQQPLDIFGQKRSSVGAFF